MSVRLRRVVERRLTDTCSITTTSATPIDDAIDPNTLKPVPSAGETPTTVYTGPCLVYNAADDRFTSAGGAPTDVTFYTVLLPSSAPVPSPGDVCTILSSQSSPALVNATLTVDSTVVDSFNIAREVTARDLVAARPLHG